MSNQVRLLFALAVLALGAGWVGMRRGNAALEAKLGSAATGGMAAGAGAAAGEGAAR